MKRVGMVLAVLVGSALSATGSAMAHGHHHGYYGGYRPAPNYGYRGAYGVGYPGIGGYGRYGGGYCGAGAGYVAPVYGYPVYPSTGFGVATPNFSLWLGQ